MIDQTRVARIAIASAAISLCLLAGAPSGALAQARTNEPRAASTPIAQSTQSTQSTINGCEVKGVVALGETISNYLGPSASCSGFDPVNGTYYIDYWEFSAISGQTLIVNHSAQFNGISAINDFYRGNVLADSSACGPSNSCTFSYTAPASSRYAVSIKAYGFGTYTLSVGAASGTCAFSPIVRNQQIDGTIDTTGCAGANPPRYFNAYQFNANIGEIFRLTYTANTLPSLYVQVDPPGTNFGHTFGSGFGSVTLDFQAQATGTYSVFAGTQSPNETGTFTLLLASAPTLTTLSLNSRFDVSVAWRTTDGRSGQGTAIPISTDTGYFWFFSASNVELVVKVLDGRGINGKWWVFYGALSNVEYTITVTDTGTGAVKHYTNPQGTLASVADVLAF